MKNLIYILLFVSTGVLGQVQTFDYDSEFTKTVKIQDAIADDEPMSKGQTDALLADKAEDDEVVHLTGSENISGTKQFDNLTITNNEVSGLDQSVIKFEPSSGYSFLSGVGYSTFQATPTGFAMGIETSPTERRSVNFILTSLGANTTNQIVIPGGGTMVTTATINDLIETYLESLSGYNSGVEQQLIHDASGVIKWVNK